MIDYTIMRELVETYLINNFTLCYIKLENLSMPTPDPIEYVAVLDGPIDTMTPSMSKVGAYTKGTLIIKIYTEINSGTQRSKVIANDLANLLSGQHLSENLILGEAFLAPSYDDAGEIPYYQQQLEVAYTANHGSPVLSAC